MEQAFKPGRRQFLGTAGAALIAAAWPGHDAWANGQTQQDALVISYPTDIPSWNPIALTLPAAQPIYATVFDTPLRYDAALKLEPRQITQWKWEDDAKQRLAVTLREDITFHDGSPLSTEDLKWTLLDFPAQDNKFAIRGMFPTLKDIEIVSPTQAVLVYGKPTPTAPIFLGFLAAYILPKAYIEKVGIEGFLEKPIGAGPYRVAQYQRGSRLTLEAYDGYWGAKPAARQVTLLFTPEASSRVALVESGRASLATGLPVREAERLKKNPALNSQIYPIATMYMLKVPSYVKPFDNDNIRKALHLAIDKQAISRALYAGQAVPLSVISIPGAPDFVEGYTFAHDKQQALKLLQQEGYSRGKPVTVRLLTTNGVFPNDYDLARVLASMWKQVGIEAIIEETTPAKAMEMSHSGKITGMVLYSWANATGDPDNGVGRILDPRLRFSMWRDESLGPRIDKLFTETDEAARIQGYQTLQKEASENSWVIPLLQGIDTLACDARLTASLRRDGYLAPEDYVWKPAK